MIFLEFDMPIYAYRCNDCGFEKDVLQKFSDAPLSDCPQCHQPAFHRMVTAPTFQLKGSGWYVTDFRGGKAGEAGAGKGNGNGSGEGAGSAGGEGGGQASAGAGGSPAESTAARPAAGKPAGADAPKAS